MDTIFKLINNSWHSMTTSSKSLFVKEFNIGKISYWCNTTRNMYNNPVSYLFIALQHKCWRSVGLLVLQPVLGQRSYSYLRCIWKVSKKEKNSMTRPRQPWTCSHPIYVWMLTEVHQAVRYFRTMIANNKVHGLVLFYKQHPIGQHNNPQAYLHTLFTNWLWIQRTQKCILTLCIVYIMWNVIL